MRFTCKHISSAYGIFSTTRYLHILQPTGDVAVTGRRRSVPAVSASISCTPPERRGSEPALMQAEVMPRQECSTTEFVQDIPNPQHLGNLASNSSEERSQGMRVFIILSFFISSFPEKN